MDPTMCKRMMVSLIMGFMAVPIIVLNREDGELLRPIIVFLRTMIWRGLTTFLSRALDGAGWREYLLEAFIGIAAVLAGGVLLMLGGLKAEDFLPRVIVVATFVIFAVPYFLSLFQGFLVNEYHHNQQIHCTLIAAAILVIGAFTVCLKMILTKTKTKK